MANPAVIQRVAVVAGNFADAAPGHRFNLYFPIWRSDWSADNTGKKDAIQKCTAIHPEIGKVLDALRARQKFLLKSHAQGLRIEAIAFSPFATGLGNEHPVENGFAFLSPYGLPYLSASGVKGVLRRAAEEMALFPEEYDLPVDEGLTILDVWWLFGFEGAAGAGWSLTRKEERDLSEEKKQRRALFKRRFDAHLETLAGRPDLTEFIKRVYPKKKDHALLVDNPMKFLHELDSRRQNLHTRGALEFWDVFPEPPKQGPYKNRLAVEIMTPHYSDYYQGMKAKPEVLKVYPQGATPHDAGQPNPIPFLAVPAGSAFDFHVICQLTYLPETLRKKWTPMLEANFRHAFDWLGFGAKTAVGYGAMNQKQPSESSLDSKGTSEKPEKARVTTQTVVWDNVKLTWNPGPQELKAIGSKSTTAPVRGKDAAKALFANSEDFDKLLAKKELKAQRVEVEIEGNRITLKRVISA